MNFGTPVPLLIGIVLIVGAITLFFVDKLKPGYGRDADKVYAILWLVCGVFLLGHLNMELLASFQQLIMAGMLIAITIENVLSRKRKADPYASQEPGEPPGRGEPPYRPSRAQSYRSSSRMPVRAELDNEPAFRESYSGDRRMLSARDERDVRDRSGYYRDGYPERYEDERPYGAAGGAPERSVERLNPGGDRIRRRRPKTVDNRYGTDVSESWSESSSRYDSDQGGYSSHAPLPPSSGSRNGGDDSYVDYRPVDYPDRESSRSPSDYDRQY